MVPKKINLQKELIKINDFLEFKRKTYTIVSYIQYILGGMLVFQALLCMGIGESRVGILLALGLFTLIVTADEVGKFLIRKRRRSILRFSQSQREYSLRVLNRWYTIQRNKISRMSTTHAQRVLRTYLQYKSLILHG